MFKNLSPQALGIAGSQNELIELTLSFGFRGLDVDIVDFAADVASQGLARARRFIESAKLQIGTFALPTRWQEDDETLRTELAKLPEWAKIAQEAGIRRAVTCIDPASDERPFHQNFELYRRRLSELGKALEPFGIQLGVGFSADPERRKDRPFEFVHGLDAFMMLLSSVSAPNVGVAIDLWDIHVSGGSLEAYRKLGAARLVSVRLSDAPADVAAAQCTAQQRQLPGESGAIDSAAALVTLAEMGFDGPVTPAADPSQLKGLRREAIIKRAGEALDRVWKTAGLNASGKLGQTVRK